MSEAMTGHGLAPGDLVRVKTTGEIGVVHCLTRNERPTLRGGSYRVSADRRRLLDPPTALVWMLEWVGRSPPALTRLECALDELIWLHGFEQTACPLAPEPNIIDGAFNRTMLHIAEQATKNHWLNALCGIEELLGIAIMKLSDAIKAPKERTAEPFARWMCPECGRPVEGLSSSSCQCGRFER